MTDLKFQEVNRNSKADLEIQFFTGDHKDGYPFDRKGGVLAHAFFPEDGRIHFDDDELFTEHKFDGVNLRIVAAHEFGHALGLDHITTPGALMNPYYRGYTEKFSLSEADINDIQTLYGKKQKPLLPSVTSVPKPTTITTKKHSRGSTTNLTIQTITTKTTNKHLLITTSKSYISTPRPNFDPTLITPCNSPINAAFYSMANIIIVHFKPL